MTRPTRDQNVSGMLYPSMAPSPIVSGQRGRPMWWMVAAQAGVQIERETVVALPAEPGFAPTVSKAVDLCEAARCLHRTEPVGVFPAMEILVDLDRHEGWMIDRARNECARLDGWEPADRLWGIDLTGIDPKDQQPIFVPLKASGPRPALAGPNATVWVSDTQTKRLTVWVDPDQPLKAADFARRTAARMVDPSEPVNQRILEAIRALPGYPIEVRSGVPYRAGASTDVKVSVTRMAETPIDATLLQLPAGCTMLPGAQEILLRPYQTPAP
jgi:hypothetical protein